MHEQLILTREEVIQILEHGIDKLHNVDLVCLVNQYTNSWIRLVEIKGDTFEWTRGEYPEYLASVVTLKQATLDKD